MTKLTSERISRKLFYSMLFIILALILISVPLIFNSYQSYYHTKRAVIQLEILQSLAETSNHISKERAPANKVMSSVPADLEKNKKELREYRRQVDQQLMNSIQLLKDERFDDLANLLSYQVVNDLSQARAQVDAYANLPYHSKTSVQMDKAILSMFAAWDSHYTILRSFVRQNKNEESRVTNYFVLILMLSELRDQAGRIASHIIPAVTFAEKMPTENKVRSEQSQAQTRYLWELIETIQPDENKTEEYWSLHAQVEKQYLREGIDLVKKIIQQGEEKNNNYSLTGTQITESIVDKFVPVVDMQNYLLKHSSEVASTYHKEAKLLLLMSIIASIVSFVAVIFTMFYAKTRVFDPLVLVREYIFALSDPKRVAYALPFKRSDREFFSLFEAVHKLQMMLQQRDEMEFKLKQMANSDALTGVANRLALAEYIKMLESHPAKMQKICLMIIDVDDFKYVNDTHGHMIGDRVIEHVAKKLLDSVRATDLIVRYGGDEFLVLIDEIGMDSATLLADKIRNMIADSFVNFRNLDIKVTVSIGISVGATSWVDLMKRADESLLKAKNIGKNRVFNQD